MLLGAIASIGRGRRASLSGAGLEACYESAAVDLAHAARYRAIIDDRGTQLPLAYFYLLAQRAQLALMLDRRFPHAIPGLIHTANEMRFLDTPQAGKRFEILVSVLPRHEAANSGRIVFTVAIAQFGQDIVRCISEYQTRRADSGKRTNKEASAEPPAPLPASSWEFDAALFRRYARLAGDFNPIHLSSLAARAFGFRAAIAHGMYAVGRSAATIERHTGQPVIAMSARFKRPIFLPGQVHFAFAASTAGAGNYSVWPAEGGSTCIVGNWAIA